ncbi:hypothetical protein W97_02605 [Coniosporium apollinis CBS 100218]|uniref:Uncharacterized protein n=1 Tax=Coniosporium apollinis (strain CBS 100218) TaxID=1168221 RepID=R7YND2_CONA1|nr:uncharacterized protein W97_02605 [Coniosporium apollinis CBS 100218]EON63378.1 hypothetical protein W97_02605 [Coniosporium apollinis CBS 100218]
MATGPITPADDMADSVRSLSPTAQEPAAYNGTRDTSVFDDAVMHLVLEPPSPSGIVILTDTNEQPVNHHSIRLADIDPPSLPTIPAHELPLPLTDPRRIYRSPLPGLLLTHPNGSPEGGPSPFSSIPTTHDEFAQHFIRLHGIRSPEELERRLGAAMQEQKDELRRRMRRREEAIEHNARIEKEIRNLVDQRAMEVKLEEKLKAGAARRREEREERERKRRKRV